MNLKVNIIIEWFLVKIEVVITGMISRKKANTKKMINILLILLMAIMLLYLLIMSVMFSLVMTY